MSWVAAFGGVALIIALGVAGLGLGTGFTGALSYLTSSVTGEHAAALSGLFNTVTRTGGVIGTAAFGTVYLALAPGGRCTRSPWSAWPWRLPR